MTDEATLTQTGRPPTATQSVNHKRWRQIDAAFNRVLASAPSNIRAFLDAHFPNDPLLAAEVEELVRLERELSKSLTGFHPPSPDSPERVALYRITGVLGRGGMGVVYRAEQSRPVERVVALKVIRQGLESQEARSRFASEQQALALMNHRNVATVYQLGHTEAGRPYLAMEYVSGDDLSSHCDRKRATLKDRVRLFLQVCDGVQHAHQKGVIHRDLKPSNTLVQESLGQPPILKLIDFGVAKSLTRKLNPSAVGTQLGVLIGTLHYSSPEQITGRYAKVDTRSDVYSLGVMLYELLSGVPPRDASDFEGRTQYELAEMFESSEPPPLAGRFLQQHNNREIAEARSTTASDVRNVLSGDLSWIVARCLERDPDARYPSAQDLRSDLTRWLEEKPVEARRTSGVYRAQKFFRRHRTGTLFGAVVTVALIATTVVAALGLVSARRAAEQTKHATKEAELAADFQTKVLRSLDPKALGRSIRSGLITAARDTRADPELLPEDARAELQAFESRIRAVNFTDLQVGALEETVFKAAEASIEQDYAEYPLLQATLWQSLSETLVQLGLLEAAVGPQDKAIAARERLLPPDDRSTLLSFQSRSLLRNYRSDMEGMLADSERALEGWRRNGDAEGLAEALYERSGYLWAVGQTDEALVVSREAVALWEKLRGAMSRKALRASGLLGRVLVATGHLAEGEERLRTAIEGLHQLEDPGQTLLLGLRGERARVLAYLGRGAEAEALIRSVVATSVEQRGARHPLTLNDQYTFGEILLEQGRFAEAEVVFERLTPNLKRNGASFLRLASAQLMQGKLDVAASTLENVPTQGIIGAIAGATRAELSRQRQRHPEALEVAQRSFTELKELVTDRFLRAESQMTVARIHLDMKHFAEAATLLNTVWVALTEIPGGKRPRLLRQVATAMVRLHSEQSATPSRTRSQDELGLWRERLAKMDKR